MKGREARIVCFTISGGACSAWKTNKASSTSVGNIAAIPIQAKSRREDGEAWEWLVLDVACSWSNGVVWTSQANPAPIASPMSRRVRI
jgi:hypothetical protein